MTALGREAAIDLTDERRSAKHQLRPDTGLSGFDSTIAQAAVYAGTNSLSSFGKFLSFVKS